MLFQDPRLMTDEELESEVSVLERAEKEILAAPDISDFAKAETREHMRMVLDEKERRKKLADES